MSKLFMAKLLSIYVDFNGQTFMAMVTVHQNHDKDEWCDVRFVDDDLYSLVSEEHLRFSFADGLIQPQELNGHSETRLMHNTIAALNERFKTARTSIPLIN